MAERRWVSWGCQCPSPSGMASSPVYPSVAWWVGVWQGEASAIAGTKAAADACPAPGALSRTSKCSSAFLPFSDPGRQRAQPNYSSTNPLSCVINGVRSNPSNNWKNRLQHCALYCWCFCGALAIKRLQRGTVKEKAKKQKKKSKKGTFSLAASFTTQPLCNMHYMQQPLCTRPNNLLPNGNKSPRTPTHL